MIELSRVVCDKTVRNRSARTRCQTPSHIIDRCAHIQPIVRLGLSAAYRHSSLILHLPLRWILLGPPTRGKYLPLLRLHLSQDDLPKLSVYIDGVGALDIANGRWTKIEVPRGHHVIKTKDNQIWS